MKLRAARPALASATLAVVAAALFLLSPIGAAGVGSSIAATPAPTGAPTALFDESGAWLREVLGGLNANERSQLLNGYLADSPALLTQVLIASHAPAGVKASEIQVAARFYLEINWGLVVIGCAAGAALGVSAGGVGAIVGCAAVGAIAYFAQTTGSAVSGSTELLSDTQLVSDATNEFASTAASWQTVLSAQNATLDFLENQASASALQQLNYSTWDPSVDVADSGVAAELSAQQQTFISEWNGFASVFAQWGVANYGPSGRFASSPAYALAGFGAQQGHLISNFENGGAGFGVVFSLATANSSVYIPPGGSAVMWCETTSGTVTGTLHEIGGGVATVAASNGGGAKNVSFSSHATGVWYGTESQSFNSACGIDATAGLPITLSTGSQTSNYVQSWTCSGTYNPCPYPALVLDQGTDVTGGESTPQVGVDQYQNPDTVEIVGHTITYPNFGLYEGNLMAKAELAAEAYWAFLRAQGYRNISSIPSNCVIPYPSGALPSSDTNALGNATAAEYLAIYEAWLNGLATFFDAPVNATNFCSGHPVFKGSSLLPGPNGVNVTGFVYIPSNGTSYPHEKFGNVTSWAINGTAANLSRTAPVQMLIYPEASSVSIPVGKVFEVPGNDPIVALAPIGEGIVFPTYYVLNGNGTDVNDTGGVHIDVSTPGAAIYLTSCTVDGTPTANCTVTLSTLQGYIANISCPGGSSGCGPQSSSSGSGGFGIGGLFSALGSFVCWITLGFVCGSAANLVGEIILIVLVILVIVVAVVLTGDYLKGRGQRPERPRSFQT